MTGESNGVEQRIQRLENRLDAQQEIIEQQQETIDAQQRRIEEQSHVIDSQQEGIEELQSGGSRAVSRRGALKAGGLLGLLGAGAVSASAGNPAGQVGTEDRPLETIHTSSVRTPDGGMVGTDDQPVGTVYTETLGSDSRPAETVYTQRVGSDNQRVDTVHATDVRVQTQVQPEEPIVFLAKDYSGGFYNNGDTITFNERILDPQGDFDTSGHYYEAPVDGYYQFYYCVLTDDATRASIQIDVNDSIVARNYHDNASEGTWFTINDLVITELSAGDQVDVKANEDFGTYDSSPGRPQNKLMGQLIAKT